MGCCMGRRSRPLHDEVANAINDKLLSHYEEVVDAITRTIWSANDVVKELKQIASEIKRYHDSVNTAQGVSAVAGMAGAAGVALSALTGGLSLTATAAAVAVAGTAGNIGSALVGEAVSKRLLDDASTALKKYESEQKKLQSLYQQFELKCKAVYWQCPRIIQRRFRLDDFIGVICQLCSRGIEAARSFASTNDGLIDTIATELKSQLAAAEDASYIYSTTAAAILRAFVFVTVAIVSIDTLKRLLGDSSSEAVRMVREAIEELENRKEQLERLLEKVQTHA